MVIFHSYVSLPEGKWSSKRLIHAHIIWPSQTLKTPIIMAHLVQHIKEIWFGLESIISCEMSCVETQKVQIWSYLYILYPDAPCMVYLPTFGWFLGQMLVNIPYMEHLGYNLKAFAGRRLFQICSNNLTNLTAEIVTSSEIKTGPAYRRPDATTGPAYRPGLWRWKTGPQLGFAARGPWKFMEISNLPESFKMFQEMIDFRFGKFQNITFSKADTNSGHIPQQNGWTWRDNVNQCSIDQDNVSALSGWPKQHQEASQETSPQRYQNISKWFVPAKPTRSCQRDMVSSQVSYRLRSNL